MAAVGTLSHELGHLLAAGALGCEAALHHSSTWVRCPGGGTPWAITAAGPLSTLLVGTLGLLLGRPAVALDARGALCFLATLFWSRPVYHLVQLGLLRAAGRPAGALRGDELRLDRLLGWPEGTLLAVTGLLGAGIVGLAVLRLPPAQRVPAALGGAIGALLGQLGWTRALGPWLLP
jgi:hypothetical protein